MDTDEISHSHWQLKWLMVQNHSQIQIFGAGFDPGQIWAIVTGPAADGWRYIFVQHT